MQKTAYDMRISDWSSDVCSSDLGMTVEDNLRMGAFPRAARAKFGQQLEFVYELFPRMRERRKQLAGTMSGGEQQMCAIGRALIERQSVGQGKSGSGRVAIGGRRILTKNKNETRNQRVVVQIR